MQITTIRHDDERRTLYFPEGWEDGIQDMGNPSDSFGMTYEHQVGNFWLDENGKEWVEVGYAQ